METYCDMNQVINDLAMRTKRREQINHNGQLVYPGPSRKVNLKRQLLILFHFLDPRNWIN